MQKDIYSYKVYLITLYIFCQWNIQAFKIVFNYSSSAKTTVKTLVTPNSFHHPKETTPITEGHKKAQKTNTGFVERRGRESGSSDDLMRKK